MLIMDRQKEIISEMIDEIHESLYTAEHIPIFDKVVSAEILAFLSGKFKVDDGRELQTIQDHIAKYAKYNSYIYNEEIDWDEFIDIDLSEIPYILKEGVSVVWVYDVFPITEKKISKYSTIEQHWSTGPLYKTWNIILSPTENKSAILDNIYVDGFSFVDPVNITTNTLSLS